MNRIPGLKAWPFALLASAAAQAARAAASLVLASGPATLSVQPAGPGYGVVLQLTNGAASYQQTNPLAVEVVDATGLATWVSAPYATCQVLNGGAWQCAGTVQSSNGSLFSFTDLFQASDTNGGFEVDRTVTVTTAAAGDAGFSTRLAFQRAMTGAMTDFDFFMPAVWYRTNAGVNATALASTLTDDYYWCREDRLPLPLFMLRELDNGATLAVTHLHPNGATFTGEDYRARLIDGRMQFASLGMENRAQPLVGLRFPGTEGERTLIGGLSTNRNWAWRSHPVTAGFTQNYSLVVRLNLESDFPTALAHTWSAARRLFSPADRPLERPCRTGKHRPLA